ncbi:MAG: hypothetical protein K2J63_11790 [Muribaculaceae bacterium]|nr:hypothetical protein [Muribaculaceae bacterium]
MKRITVFLITAFLLGLSGAMAQSSGGSSQSSGASAFEKYKAEKKAEFERYKQEKRTEFEQYRQRLNEEYAKMISSSWNSYKGTPAPKETPKPKPVTPERAKGNTVPTPRQIPVKEIKPAEKPIPDVPVTIPKVKPGITKAYPINFTFFNTKCGIENFDTSLLSIGATDNASLGKAWKRLTADNQLDQLTDDCLRLREELNLCDWGYLLLVEKVAATLYPKSPDCQAFLTTALLNQSGYDCRIAKKEGHLALMYHPSHRIHAQTYYMIDGKSYYIHGPLAHSNSDTHTYGGDFRKSPTPIRMVMDRYPHFVSGKDGGRVYHSDNWKAAPPFSLKVNPSVIDFLATYPQVDWHLYGLAPVSDELNSTLFQAMAILTEGMGEVEAVNLLLSYHHYGYEYMTDGDQFGKEKPFFFDENYFYPYNDCEDRAIMFSRLVRDILGLDVVYLEFPGHLAAAVRFSPGTQVKGATVDVDGKTYVACDPTCIGASAGYLDPKYLSVKPTVHKIRL